MKFGIQFTFSTKPRGWWSFYAIKGQHTSLIWCAALHFLRYFEIFVEVYKKEE